MLNSIIQLFLVSLLGIVIILIMSDNVGGRPSLYQNVEALEKKIDEYFESIKGSFELVKKTDEEGNKFEEREWTKLPEPATITGLCLFVGFESRQSFYDYEKKPEFSYTIKRAKLRIENSYEVSGLSTKTPTFHIFALKNLGWSDKQEIDHTTGGDKINVISLGNGIKP